MSKIAQYHARRRTQKIKRQFVPGNAPLSAIESNYIGSLGEIALRFLFMGERELADNYDEHKVDSGDIEINSLMYDVKTEAVPQKFYSRLYSGKIEAHKPYGCRVWTASHLHHLHKYNGGVIFAATPVPDNSKESKKENELRRSIIDYAGHLLVVGFVRSEEIKKKKPSLYSPPHPHTGRRRKYNSKNFIFHHTEIRSIKELSVRDVP